MTNRLRFLQFANGLMYFGPLLAGLGGFGWRVVPAFTLIFALWLFLMNPADWPRGGAEWRAPDSLLNAGGRLVVQVLLVALLFGLGRGIGGVMGSTPQIPVMLPVGLSFLAIPLARLIWTPGPRSASPDASPTAGDSGASLPSDPDLAFRMTQPLADLPAETALGQIEAHLAALAPHLPPVLLLRALWERGQAPEAPRHLRQAFILQATDAHGAELCAGQAAPVRALQIAAGNDALLILFATRCSALLQQNVDVWGDCPNAAALEAVAARSGPEAARTLRALAALNLRLAPLNGDGRGVVRAG